MRRSRASAEATATREVTKPDEQWRQELTPLRYRVLRKAHTEMAFTGAYLRNHRDGFYRCAGCGARLFSSDAKFYSGTGWPSFNQPAVAEAVELRPDNGLFLRRTEVVCRRCANEPILLLASGMSRGWLAGLCQWPMSRARSRPRMRSA